MYGYNNIIRLQQSIDTLYFISSLLQTQCATRWRGNIKDWTFPWPQRDNFHVWSFKIFRVLLEHLEHTRVTSHGAALGEMRSARGARGWAGMLSRVAEEQHSFSAQLAFQQKRIWFYIVCVLWRCPRVVYNNLFCVQLQSAVCSKEMWHNKAARNDSSASRSPNTFIQNIYKTLRLRVHLPS